MNYETLESAWAAVADGETITLLADCSGNGIVAEQGKFTQGVTVDFAGFTYTMDGAMVGSSGTQTQAFQLLKDNKITFKNGTIYSEKALMLVQNYSDLTLEGMTLTLKNPNYASAYTLSNNNGNVVIDGTTINSNPAGGFAFDVCRYASYPSVSVTVKGESVINGNIEVSASGSDAKDGFSLMLEGGTLNGAIVLDASAKTAMANTPEKAAVSKSNALTGIDAPADYKWVDNGDGTSTLAPCSYVAQIGTTKYESLADAIAAVGDGETITMLCDVDNAAGLSVPEGKNFTVDFAGYTYTLNKPGAGSTGTETIGFQLLKNSTIIFKNGTINISEDNLTEAVAPAKNIKRIIQNYANLTLENMTIDGTNQYGDKTYVVSFNNGTSNIIGSTSITAGETGVSPIMDVYLNSSYTGTNVTINTTGVIGGDIETCCNVSQEKADACSLTITNADVLGTIRNSGNYEIPVSVSGGIYDEEVLEHYCAEGYVCVPTDDGRFTVMTKEDAGIYELVDREDYKYTDGVQNVQKVTYRRTFGTDINRDLYQSWVVPFDYTVQAEDLEKFDFYKIHMIAGSNNEQGGVVEDVTQIYIFITKLEAGTVLKGNKPYVIKPKSTDLLPIENYEFVATDVDLLKEDVGSLISPSTTDYRFDFKSVYSTVKPSEVFYALSVNGKLNKYKAGTQMKSYRWIIFATPLSDDYSNFNFIFTEFDPSVDGITETSLGNESEIEGIFTVSGMKQQSLTRGLNIVKYKNGTIKKIFIK